MISIIVCSTNAELLAKFKLNVAATIGITYELLAYDNRLVCKGIAEVYNQIASEAAYDILCFVHEDVIIHTNGWGEGIKKLLSNNGIGLVGISGAVYKSKYPGTWSTCHSSLYRTHSIQHFKKSVQPVVTNVNPGNASHAVVAVIDGVFMATRKDVFHQYSFDSNLLKGFHGYDIDYSMKVGQNYELVVTYGLLIEHLSEGILNEMWLHDSLLVHEKWKNKLPLNSCNLSDREMHFNDYLSSRNILAVALHFQANKRIVLLYYFRLLFTMGKYNRFKFSKSVLKYLLFSTTSKPIAHANRGVC
ncbi:MAG TPA: hypothetical protein DEB23_05930 [Chitinophagaceae bacterium]|nr:hypothetical protein [Chitinophagaceae bacterium]